MRQLQRRRFVHRRQFFAQPLRAVIHARGVEQFPQLAALRRQLAHLRFALGLELVAGGAQFLAEQAEIFFRRHLPGLDERAGGDHLADVQPRPLLAAQPAPQGPGGRAVQNFRDKAEAISEISGVGLARPVFSPLMVKR